MIAWSAVAAVGLLAAAVTASEIARRAAVQRRTHAAIRLWRETDAATRLAAFERAAHDDPRSAAAWFLLGCATLADRRPGDAARFFGMAYHADIALGSAALLTFTCLKAAGAADEDPDEFLQCLIDTWNEMRRPELVPSRREQLLADTLAADAPPPTTLSPLGRIGWLAGGPAMRAELNRLSATGPPWSGPLLEAVRPATAPAAR